LLWPVPSCLFIGFRELLNGPGTDGHGSDGQPCAVGWLDYYGRFYLSAMNPVPATLQQDSESVRHEEIPKAQRSQKPSRTLQRRNCEETAITVGSLAAGDGARAFLRRYHGAGF
jgi:hypothetical protein